jgi:U3 small nucleolar RNA-associated protein 19
VASFVKLFLRYAIKGSYQLSVWTVGFTMNSIRTHPSLQKLLERGSNIDTYNINEPEPLNSDALNSSLWEILILKKHYSINIRDLLKDITKDPLLMPKLNLSELIRNTPEHTPPPIYAQDYINNLIHHT